MTPAHCRYLLLEQGLGAALVNVVINGAIVWLMFHSANMVPLWGPQSIAGDTLATCFLLPLITCLIATRLARGEAQKGRLPALPAFPSRIRLPYSTKRRGLLFGGLCVLIVALPTIGLFSSIGIREMTSARFMTFKIVFAASLGGLITPFIARCGLGDTATTANS